MKKNGYYYGCTRISLFFAILIALVSNASEIPAQAPDRFAKAGLLEQACQLMADGNFQQAGDCLKQLHLANEAESSSYVLQASRLIEDYCRLMDAVTEERQKTYQKYLDQLNQNKKEILWRQDLLRTSQNHDLDEQEKKELESKLQEKVHDLWINSLAQLTACHNLSERMDLPDQVPAQQRQEIISQSLQIAQSLEQEQKGLEAYQKVYYFLSSLDEQMYQYDDLYRRLSRQEAIKKIYVPDPNAAGIDWKDRREGITFSMVYSALASVSVNYVEEPDFPKMAHRALENCVLLTETQELKDVFPVLTDTEMVKAFCENLKTLNEKVDEIQANEFGYTYLLGTLDSLVNVNEQTLNLPKEVIIAEFAEGAFACLDSYTYIVWPYEVDEFQKNITNQFDGIGVVITKDPNGFVTVDSLLSYESPAYKAGLDAGDSILAVDGTDISQTTLEKVVEMITGPAGTEVVLTIDREAFDEPRDFSVFRHQVKVPTLLGLYRDRQGQWQHFANADEKIAYIRLTHFAEQTPEHLRAKLKELNEQGMKGLILDLRGNSGGYLSGAVDVVDAFIQKGQVVKAKYRNPLHEDTHLAGQEHTVDLSLPLVVLIDSSSASASEIVSGSLQDNHRATIIGARSFGKGNVQTIQSLEPTKAEMKITIAYYYLPSGRRVHHDPEKKGQKDYGVNPDIKLELTSKQIETFLKTQRKAGILHRDDATQENPSWDLFTTEEIIDSDPQLHMAFLNLQAQLLRQNVKNGSPGLFVAESQKTKSQQETR